MNTQFNQIRVVEKKKKISSWFLSRNGWTCSLQNIIFTYKKTY